MAWTTPGPGRYNALDVSATFPGPLVRMATSERPEVRDPSPARAPAVQGFRNVQRLRGGLVVKVHRLLYHSTLLVRMATSERPEVRDPYTLNPTPYTLHPKP